ncbi:MAG: hypothetical protein BAJALOKI3v1_660020 [Promethearchaeota archaeon]|jgi:hypothetical protein|nr:MAG: hypothetical protein BAJALOKI3v1_660020 [Candidatus Lokiarchaeota archaeon]
MYSWIHIIDSKESYDHIWNTIAEYRDLHLGSYIIIDGFLTLKDGRVFGNKSEVIAGITTYTYEKETMEKMFELKLVDSSKTVLFTDLDPEEIITTEKGALILKKAKLYKSPVKFEDYLEKIRYKNFKEED